MTHGLSFSGFHGRVFFFCPKISFAVSVITALSLVINASAPSSSVSSAATFPPARVLKYAQAGLQSVVHVLLHFLQPD